jgi:hypothetical protein
MPERAYDRCETPAHSFKSLWKSDYERMTGIRVFALWTVPIDHRRSRSYLPLRKSKWIRKYRGARLGFVNPSRDLDTLKPLENAVRAQDETAFAIALEAINWQSRPASDFMRAIDLALKVGTHLAARRLAIKGAGLHFDDEEMQKYARILAPPQVLRTQASRQVDVAANVEWLKANKENYKGMWVAVKDGTLIASANSHTELIAEIGETKGSGILVTNL